MQIAAVVQAKHMHAHRKVISLINEYRYHVTIFIEGTFIYPRFLLSFAKDEERITIPYTLCCFWEGGERFYPKAINNTIYSQIHLFSS